MELKTDINDAGGYRQTVPGTPATGYGDFFKNLIAMKMAQRRPVGPAAPVARAQPAAQARAPRPDYTPQMGQASARPPARRTVVRQSDPMATLPMWAGSAPTAKMYSGQYNPDEFEFQEQNPGQAWR